MATLWERRERMERFRDLVGVGEEKWLETRLRLKLLQKVKERMAGPKVQRRMNMCCVLF